MQSSDLLLHEDGEGFREDNTRRKKPVPKAMELLGRDSSKEKIMACLGIGPEDLDKAAQLRAARQEENLEVQRQREQVKNKRESTKGTLQISTYQQSQHWRSWGTIPRPRS